MSGFRSHGGRVAAALLAAFGGAGCAHEQTPQPVYNWGPAYGQPAAGTPGATAPGAAPAATVATAPAGAPIAASTPTLTAVGPADPINNHDLTFLRGRAQQILNELVAALPPPQQARVNGIPLVVDSTPGEVNAFASCSGSSPAMAITDGLLQIESQLARFRAYDELAGSNKVGEYIGIISQQAQPKRP